jgi:Na+-driven multidrug efflux pump
MDEMLMLMGAGPNTLEQCQTYLQLYLWAVPGILLPILFSGLVVGEGNTVLPLAVGLLETVLDVFLDSLFIRGFWIIPPLGIRGAATATILPKA